MGAWDLERKRKKGEKLAKIMTERLVAEAQETAKAWVDSLVGDVDIGPK